MPSVGEWMRDTGEAGPSIDALDARVVALLTRYPEAKDKFAQYFVMSDLFWTTDAWLKNVKTKPEAAKKREPQMYELYKFVVLKLCEFFNVGVNSLPAKVSRTFFKEMVHDEPGEAKAYMDDIQREEYRLVVNEGKIYLKGGITLLNTNSGDFLSNVSQIDWRLAHLSTDAGFVMSLWNELYMTKHDPDLAKFHSQYMGGKPVICAGEMTVRNGILRRINNSSGHYRPDGKHLLPVLWLLMQKGVGLGAVELFAYEATETLGLYGVQCSAQHFLNTGGKPTQGITQWIQLGGEWPNMAAVSGRLTMPNAGSLEGYIVRFTHKIAQTMNCRGIVKANGTYSLETELRAGEFGPGAPCLNTYSAVVLPPGSPTKYQKYWPADGSPSVMPGVNNQFEVRVTGGQKFIAPRK